MLSVVWVAPGLWLLFAGFAIYCFGMALHYLCKLPGARRRQREADAAIMAAIMNGRR